MYWELFFFFSDLDEFPKNWFMTWVFFAPLPTVLQFHLYFNTSHGRVFFFFIGLNSHRGVRDIASWVCTLQTIVLVPRERA